MELFQDEQKKEALTTWLEYGVVEHSTSSEGMFEPDQSQEWKHTQL